MTGGAFEIGGARAWISRSGYTGEDGFEISILARDAETVATLLANQDEVKPIGLGARDSLRLEAGLPLYGHDLDQHTTPVEADLTFALSKRRRAEGGFPGWPRIAKELEQGALRKRVGLAVEGRQPVREGALVLDGEGNEVGKVTSRRLLAEPRGADRHGLCSLGFGRAGHARSRSNRAASSSPARSRRCRSFRIATSAREAPDDRLLHEGT